MQASASHKAAKDASAPHRVSSKDAPRAPKDAPRKADANKPTNSDGKNRPSKDAKDKPTKESSKEIKHKPSKDSSKEASKSKTKAAPPPAPPAPTPARLLLRLHSAKQLHHGVFSQGVYCKMYVGETAMLSGSQKGLFGKSEADEEREAGSHRVFRTKTVPQPTDSECVALWDENFDVHIPDVSKDILSVRVKSRHRLYQSVLGACAIPLKQLRIGHSVDRWVPLLKGSREVATLRLQILLSPIHDPQKVAERSKADLQADIKTALAANQSADEAIERLLASATFKSSSNRGGAVVVVPDEADDDHHDNNDRHDANGHKLQQHKNMTASTQHAPTATA